jgi:hypothetical protein
MIRFLSSSVILTLLIFSGCSREKVQTPLKEQCLNAGQLAYEVAEILPEGWKFHSGGIDDAPNQWSGKTEAEWVRFEHVSLKFRYDGISPASFTLWRTPIEYEGSLKPGVTDQSGGAWIFGISEEYRWFMEGLLPEQEEWAAVQEALFQRFSIQPPE